MLNSVVCLAHNGIGVTTILSPLELGQLGWKPTNINYSPEAKQLKKHSIKK